MEPTKYEIYVQRKGWNVRPSGSDQLNIEVCPFCTKDNYHFYLNKNNGLWQCQKCGESGNYYKLMTHLGDREDGITSTRDSSYSNQAPAPLPNVAAASARLLANEEAMDYLVAERGFTTEVIERQKLGLATLDGQPYIVIPYYSKGNLLYAKFRSLPPAEKSYRGVAGRDLPLYNEDAVVPGLKDLLITEGELDTLACLAVGIEAVVAVPGANIKKATWIDKIDAAAPEKIYLLYDRDKVGQEAARDMAIRIGLDKVYNIVLPEFKRVDGEPGKDVNEWLRAGHTLDDLEALKTTAQPFDVVGVTALGSALDALETELRSRETLQPKYDSPWPSLNKLFGGAEPGDVIDLLAEGKVGKAQPLDSQIMLHDGSYTDFAHVQIGMEVASVDGARSVVVAIHERGILDSYAVTLQWGRRAYCCGEHLWEVKLGNGTNWEVAPLRKISEWLQGGGAAYGQVYHRNGGDPDVYVTPFENIYYVGRAQMRCITVSHPSGLYITDDGIVTHNSTMALNWADYLVSKYNESCLYECLEMTPARLARKWVSYVTQTDDTPGHTSLDTMLEAVSLAKDVARNREGDLLFGYNKVTDPKEVYDVIRQAVRRYGIKFAVIDNIQLLADSTLKGLHNRTVHISQISKSFKMLATELGIVIIRIIQPNRVREGEIADARNADGASQIEKDCDAMIVLHRNRKASMKQSDFATMPFVEVEDTFDPQMLTKVVLSRYAGGGITTLRMDGHLSTVREWSDSERASSSPVQAPGELPVTA